MCLHQVTFDRVEEFAQAGLNYLISEESAPSRAPDEDIVSSSPSLAPNTFSVTAAGKKAKQRERRKRKAQAFAAKKSDGSGL